MNCQTLVLWENNKKHLISLLSVQFSHRKLKLNPVKALHSRSIFQQTTYMY